MYVKYLVLIFLSIYTFAASDFITKTDMTYYYNIKTQKCEETPKSVIEGIKFDLLYREAILVNKIQTHNGTYSTTKSTRTNRITLFSSSLDVCTIISNKSPLKEQLNTN